MMATRKNLTPAAVNRAIDAINRKKNPAPEYTVHWRSPVSLRWQSASESTAAAAQKTARNLISEGARDVSISRYRNGRAEDVPIRDTKKTRTVRVVAANPLQTQVKTTRRQSLVGGNYWSVLFYAGKDKPSGKPDIVYPASSKEKARAFAASLEKAGASGVAVLELTKARV